MSLSSQKPPLKGPITEAMEQLLERRRKRKRKPRVRRVKKTRRW